MSITKDELIAQVKLNDQRRRATVRGINRYYDSILVPLAEMTSHVWADANDINVSISGDASDMAAFFRLMRTNGFEPDSRPKDAQTEFRTWFRHDDGTQFYLAFSSTVCKRVQIGTRTVEEPIYEIRCDDATVPGDVVEAPPALEESLS